jgi:hypothetical protein
MPVVQELKRIAEELNRFGRPRRRALARLTRPRLPSVVPRGVLQLDEAVDRAAVCEETFAHHGWHEAWRSARGRQVKRA